MKKKFLAFLLTALMVLNLLPAGVFAAEVVQQGSCGENLTWTLDSYGVLTISGEGEMEDYETFYSESPWYDSRELIKAVIIEESVSSIGNYAFESCSNLTNISIPESVISIGENAFFYCTSLVQIAIPANVTSIGYDAFYNCTSLQKIEIDDKSESYCVDEYGVIFNKDKTVLVSSVVNYAEKYTVPDTVITIEEHAFCHRYSMPVLTIPESVMHIKDYAFSFCDNTSFVFEGKAPEVGENIFWCCYNANVYYPDDPSWTEEVRQNYGGTITWIPESEGGFVTGALTWTLSEEGVLTISGKGKMEDFDSWGPDAHRPPWNDDKEIVKNVVIEDGVTSIGNNAFYWCTSLTEISIPASVTSIGDYAFDNCTSLASVEIPKGVTTIGHGAFWNCISLTEVSIPESVTSIGDNAFIYCPAFSSCEHGWALVHEKVESTCTESGYEAIYKCLNCGEIKGGEYIEPHSWGEWSTTKDATCGEDGTKERTCMACSEVEQGIIAATGEHSWGEWSEWKHENDAEYCDGCTMESTRSCPVCGSVQTSEKRHLRVPGMSDDYGVTIPESVYMGETFDMTVRFPEIPGTKASTIQATIEFDNTKVEVLEWNVGSVAGGNTMFTTVYDANMVGSLGFTVIGYGGENEIDLSEGLGATASFKAKENVDKVDFNVSEFYVQMIDESNGTGIELVMSEDIETELTINVVDPRIDYGNTGDLTWALDIEGHLTITGEGAMADYDQAKAPWYRNNDKVKTITIDNTVTHIGNNAFYGLEGVESIIIPEGITSIGANAFTGCSALKNIEFMGYAPSISEDAFTEIKADAKYFANKEWSAEQKANYGGNLDWKEVQKEIVRSGNCGQNLTWTLDVDGELTISGTGDMYDYYDCWEVPWFNDGPGYQVNSVVIKDGVTSIGDCAFMRLGSLKSVKIPDSVTRIGESAFERCSNLKTIKLPDELTKIERWTFYRSGLTAIDIPKGVTSIGQAVFGGCESLTEVDIPNTVTKIGNSAFESCSSLTSIEIPDSVTSLGSSAFSNCYELADVDLSNKITEIGSEAFANCSKLEVITLPESLETLGSDAFRRSGMKEYKVVSGSKYFSVIDGILYSKDGKTLVSYPYAKEMEHLEIPDTVTTIAYRSFCGISTLGGVTIPTSVKSIEKRAFSSCTGITSLTIPGSVETIGVSAFNDNNLTELTLEKGIKTIGESAFAYSDFTTLTIPEGVTSIAERAFENCDELKEVTILNGPAYLDEYVFGWCDSLETVTLPESVKEIHPDAFNGCNSLKNINGESFSSVDGVLFSKDGKTLIRYFSSSDAEVYTIPEGTEIIAEGAFTGCDYLLSVNIPNTVKEISDEAFRSCWALRNITIPGSVKSIGEYAFNGCWNLRTVEIKSGVESIGENAFLYCESLNDITLPDSITSIGQSAFEGCGSLTEVTVPKGLKDIPANMFYECYNLEKVTIQSGVEYIGDNVFANCSSLKEVSIPDTVKSMEHNVFSYCYNLTSVKLPSGLESIPRNTFRGCEKLKNVNIPGSVKSIGDSAFDGCYALTSIKLPDSVTTIGDNVFSYCTNLESVNIPKNVTSVAYGMFEGCSSLKSLDIPQTVTSIGNNAFTSCSALTDISIPESVTEIGNSAFSNCGSLTSIELPDGITSLNSTFPECGSLKSVSLPANLETLGNDMFTYCVSLEELTIPASVTTIGYDPFYECSSLSKLYFEGNAPSSLSGGTLAFCSPDLELYYVEGRTGWTDSPAYNAEEGTWYGYPLNKLEVTMSIKELPILLEYDEWAKSVDPAGGKIEISYGEKKNIVDMTSDMLSGFTPAKLGTQTITVTYGDNTATFEIKVTHVYNHEVTAPTCTEQGYTTHTCLACKQTYKDSFVEALGHKEEVIAGKDATCTETGLTEGKHCSVCDEVFTAQEVILKKDHAPVIVGKIDATCEKAGYTGDTECSVCKQKIATGTVVEKLAHTEEVITGKAATCTESGLTEGKKCTVCGTVTVAQEEIAALGHKEEVIAGKDATCMEDGLTDGSKCSVCGVVLKEQTVVPATGHTIRAVEAKDPTIGQDGCVDHFACDCGAVFADIEGKEELKLEDVLIPKLIKVEEGKAEVSNDAVADAIEKAEDSDIVKIPIIESEESDDDVQGGTEGGTEEKPQEKPKVSTTVIPAEAITTVVETEKAIEIETKSYTVTLDNKALGAVNDVISSAGTEEAPAQKVEINVTEVKEETLTEKQQEVLETKEVAVVISMDIVCGEEKVSDFNGGTMTVKIPFEPKEGTKGDDYTVIYVADDGHTEEVKTAYENGCIVMQLSHLSDYVIINKFAGIMCGDANTDNAIDAKDATQILRYINGKAASLDKMNESQMLAAADVNDDKAVDAKDATQILRYVNGKASSLDKLKQ